MPTENHQPQAGHDKIFHAPSGYSPLCKKCRADADAITGNKFEAGQQPREQKKEGLFYEAMDFMDRWGLPHVAIFEEADRHHREQTAYCMAEFVQLKLKAAFAVMGEVCELIERPPAKSERPNNWEQYDYIALREHLHDWTSTFYGPHPCPRCGESIFKRALEQGGEEYNDVSGLASRWLHSHKCEAAQPQPEPAQKLTDMLEPRLHAAVPIDCKHNLLNSTGICAECGELQPEPAPMKPSVTLLVKLGSIAVHAEELISPMGHGYDKIALEQLLADPEVIAWRKEMDKMAMLPVKRSKK